MEFGHRIDLGIIKSKRFKCFVKQRPFFKSPARFGIYMVRRRDFEMYFNVESLLLLIEDVVFISTKITDILNIHLNII